MAIFQGMRATSNFEADGTFKRRPENWREMILMLYPNGQAPLTALTALMGSEKTDDPIFHWFEKEFPTQIVTSTGVYEGSGVGGQIWLAAARATNDVASVKMAEADMANFKVGHIITVRASASGDVTKNVFQLLITAVAAAGAGANSYVTGKIIGGNFTSLASASYTLAEVGGSAYPEGDTSGSSIGYDPTDYSNYTQIFRNSLENTRTAAKTRLRTGDAIAQAKKECLELHSIEIERALMFNGPKYTATGTNGKPLRITSGLRGFITSANGSMVKDFRVDGSVANGLGTTWADSSADAAKTYNYILTLLEQLFRYGSQEKLAFCGAGALLALQKLLIAMPNTQIQLSPTTNLFGMKVQELTCPFGTLALKSHPLMTLNAATTNDTIVLDTKYVKYRYIDDTSYKPNRGANDLDGEKSEYLTECGMEMHFPKSHALLNGWGTVKGS